MARTTYHTQADRAARRDLAPWELDAQRRAARKASKSWRADRKGARSIPDMGDGGERLTLADRGDFSPN